MQNNSLISIVIPIYNTSSMLSKCLDSVVHQTYTNLEIILVNDGSTDNSLEIIMSYKETDARIKVVNKENGGLSSARNAGLKIATGRYVLHIDSDDWIELNMCESLISVAEGADVDIVSCDVFFETPGRTSIRKEPYSNCEFGDSFLYKYIVKKGLNSVCNKLIRMELYNGNGIMHYEDISLGEDFSALLRLVVVSQSICHVNKPFYHYNLKSSGMSRGIKKNVMEYYRGVSKVEDFYRSHGFSTDFFPLLRLKVAYSELSQCSLKKAWQLGYSDYKVLAKFFLEEMPSIVQNTLYKKVNLKYKLFLHAYRMYYFMCKKYTES